MTQSHKISEKAQALAHRFAAKSPTAKTSSINEWDGLFQWWRIAEGQTLTFRFLPDLNPNNPMQFLFEYHTHDFVTADGSKKTLACAGEGCPVCAASREFYRAKDEVNGKKLYRKKQFLAQGIVLEAPIDHDHTKTVKLIALGPALYKVIEAAVMSDDLEEVPHEPKGGYNFRFKKTKAGEFASYSTSSFAPKQSDLSDELIAKANLELVDLSTKAPLPNLAELQEHLQRFLQTLQGA